MTDRPNGWNSVVNESKAHIGDMIYRATARTTEPKMKRNLVLKNRKIKMGGKQTSRIPCNRLYDRTEYEISRIPCNRPYNRTEKKKFRN